jgi:hypothetical protein
MPYKNKADKAANEKGNRPKRNAQKAAWRAMRAHAVPKAHSVLGVSLEEWQSTKEWKDKRKQWRKQWAAPKPTSPPVISTKKAKAAEHSEKKITPVIYYAHKLKPLQDHEYKDDWGIFRPLAAPLISADDSSNRRVIFDRSEPEHIHAKQIGEVVGYRRTDWPVCKSDYETYNRSITHIFNREFGRIIDTVPFEYPVRVAYAWPKPEEKYQRRFVRADLGEQEGDSRKGSIWQPPKPVNEIVSDEIENTRVMLYLLHNGKQSTPVHLPRYDKPDWPHRCTVARSIPIIESHSAFPKEMPKPPKFDFQGKPIAIGYLQALSLKLRL